MKVESTKSGKTGRLLLFLALALTARQLPAIEAGQVDDFEDGTVMGWQEGNPTPNPPVNVANGGPLGAGDNYLRNASSGGGGPGSRMAMLETNRWAGDYNAAGVQSIRMWLRNEGNNAMQVRIALHSGGTWFASTDAFNLPADNEWREATFELDGAAMSRIEGAADLETVLGGVTEMRIVSSAQPHFRGDPIVATLGVDNIEALAPMSGPAPTLWSFMNLNGNNKTDLGVLLRNPENDRNTVYVMDGGSGNQIRSVAFGMEPVLGSTTVADANDDLVPEFAVLVEGSLFARVKDVANGSLLGTPSFKESLSPLAALDVGDTGGGGAGPDMAVVGMLPNGNVQAQTRDVASGSLVKTISFNENYIPVAAVTVDDVGASPAREIAVLGVNGPGKVRAQVKDARNGKQIRAIGFNPDFEPLHFAAAPNPAGRFVFLAVLGQNGAGAIKAQIKRAGNGNLVNTIGFSKNFTPVALLAFADSNGSGGGEIAVVGVNGAGKVRAQVKEIADGTQVGVFTFSKNFPPHGAIAVNGVAGTGRNEIAVLGENAAGQLRIQVKDLLTGDQVKSIPVP